MINPIKVRNLAAKINYLSEDTLGSVSIILKEKINPKLKLELIQGLIAKCNDEIDVLKGN